MKVYQIRHKTTGLFAKRGVSETTWQGKDAIWSKKGSVWTGLQALNLHLSQFINSYNDPSGRFMEYINAEIIEYGENGINIYGDCTDYFKKKLQKELDRVIEQSDVTNPSPWTIKRIEHIRKYVKAIHGFKLERL